MSLNLLNTNKRTCFLNISANEMICSLFYNKSIWWWPIFEFFDVKFMDGLFIQVGNMAGYCVIYIYIYIYIHILPTLPTLCHCLLNNFIYIYTFYLHYQPLQLVLGATDNVFCVNVEKQASTLKRQIIIYLELTLFTRTHFKSHSGHIQFVIIICQ
jgi:hypothetical protein